MKRFRHLFVSILLMGSLSACGAIPGSGPDPSSTMPWEPAGEGAGGQAGQGGEDGFSLNRPGGSASDLAARGGYGSEPGGYGSLSEPEHRVYFDFNSAMINEMSANILAGNARWLNTFPGSLVTIEGHADERGTREYNLALGQNRADSVKSYLISQGVDAARLRTISYGKERPLVNGHDDYAWNQNRRAEIVKQ